MTSDTSTPVARVRDLPDLLGVIPHLLGFHPEESMVLLVVDGGRVELTARADLADLCHEGHLELLIDQMLLRWPAGGMWLVAYSADEQVGWSLLRRAEQHLGSALRGDLVCVSGRQFQVCDPSGPRLRHDPASSASAAAATFHGLQARRSRSELGDLIRADPRQAALSRRAWAAASERLLSLDPRARPAELLGAIAAARSAPDQLGLAELAWLGLLVRDPLARDEAVLSLERPAASSWVEIWSRVVRACPPGSQDQPLAVLALAAWVAGEGALQSICLEELDTQGARPGLKGMLEQLSEAIVPPQDWDALRVQLRALVDGTGE